jgi:DNA-binding transcriptional ArsR family regulator
MPRKDTQTADLFKAAPLFAALGDPVRLAMITRLSGHGPLPTVQLKQSAGVSRQAITKHLQVLENAGLLHSDRVGRDRQWRMHTERFSAARDYLDLIAKQWDERLHRLRAFVEEKSD